jgi:hypothetical protein
MVKIYSDASFYIPFEIKPITPFYPVFPASKQKSVQLAGIQVR